MSEPVLYEAHDGVVWVTINRPEARNALNHAVRDALFAAIRRFDADADAKVLVLTGAGDIAFCAGGDLKEMADTTLEAPPADFLPIIGRNVQVDKVTIAAVNGVAYAGGFLLAQMCDLVVAAESATFAITEARVGRGTPWATPLPWLIPPRIAMELLVTGDPISAQRAHEVHLVNRLVASGDLHDAAAQLAQRIIANAPLSVSAAKATVTLSARQAYGADYDCAEQIWEPVYRSEDAQEGPSAFRDGRPPVWRSR
jgi:enoyl-CoA hydratase/carnithine racemase